MKTKFKKIISLLLVFTVIFSSTVLSSSAKSAETKVSRDTVLVLDISGSMDGTPMSVMKQAAKKFCEAVLSASGNNRVAIVAFESSCYVLDFISDLSILEAYINKLNDSGGTNLYSACSQADSLLANSSASVKNMVILTDGLPQSGAYSSSGQYTSMDSSYYYDYANAVYSLVKGFKNYAIYTLGFFHTLSGSDLTFARRFLNDLQNSGYYDVTNADDLEFVFGEIAGDIADEVKVVDYYIESEGKYSKVSINVNFKDSFFAEDSEVYNHDLARLCSQFTVAGYTKSNGLAKNAEGYLSAETVLENALISLGFSEPESDLSTTETQVNYFIANRKINVDAKEYTLIFTGFIGSYYPQWYNNFDPGTGETHEGFNSAKKFAYKKLENYIKDRNLNKDNTIFLITGHSRGAATSNLVAAQLIKDEKYATADNIFTYAFATPNSTSLPERNNEEYKRIFNIVNPEDFVTKVLPTSWDYGRYGTTYTLPSKSNMSSSRYDVYVDNMQPYFSLLTKGETYHPFEKGTKATSTVIKKLSDAAGDIDGLYEPNFKWLGESVSLQEFFQKTLCSYVGEKPGSPKIEKAQNLLIDTFIKRWSSDSVILAITDYFIGNEGIGSFTSGIVSEKFFTNAHQAETYCAYMMTMSEKAVTNKEKPYIFTINCPVDAEVIDKSTGEVVGRIVDNTVDETVEAKENSIVADVDGDSKSFWIPSDGDYEIRLTGNGSGTMDCTVAEIDPDLGETSRINFFDVEIEDGLKLTGEMDGETFELEEFELEYESGKKLSPTEQIDGQNEKVTVYTEAVGNGFVSPTMTVTRGDYVTVSATAEDANSYFVEWYDLDTGETLSNDAEYSFVAKEDINLGAYFYTNEFFVFEPSTYNINYGDILVLEAYKGDLPEGAQLIWYTEGNSVDAWSYWDDDSVDYVEGIGSGYSTIYVEVVDEYGNPILDGEGNPYNDAITVYCNGSFIMRLISFFKNLFGIDRYVY